MSKSVYYSLNSEQQKAITIFAVNKHGCRGKPCDDCPMLTTRDECFFSSYKHDWCEINTTAEVLVHAVSLEILREVASDIIEGNIPNR